MKYLALDIGTKKTGVATSDDGGVIAIPHSVIDTQGSLKILLPMLVSEGIKTVIVGDSKSQTNIHNSIQEVLLYIKSELTKEGIKVVVVDESFTSYEARRIVGTSKKENKKNDARAAALILQRYLDNTF